MPPEKKTNGALVGSIIIILILIIGGIYIFKAGVREDEPTPLNTQQDTTSLDAEVNSIDLDNVDEGM